MIWTDADREAFVKHGPRLWAAVPETKPEIVNKYGSEWFIDGSRLAPRSVVPDDLAAAFGLAVAMLAKHHALAGHACLVRYTPREHYPWSVTAKTNRREYGEGLLVAAYRALYAVHGLEWEEVTP